MVELTTEHKATIKKYAIKHVDWLKTSEGQDNIKEHQEHHDFFKRKFSLDNLKRMNENEFREIYKKLWASNIWTNKDWYIDNKLLEPNGIIKIKEGLVNLLYGTGEINERLDEFRKNIKGFGISSISEILHFVFPDKFCLWNEKPKTVLPFLKINLLPEKFFRYQISTGGEYLQCNKVLETIKNELANYGFKKPNFIDLDIFLWHIFKGIPSKPIKREEKKEVVIIEPKEIRISSHPEAEYYLLKLGEMLGYYTYTADRSGTYKEGTLGDVAMLKEIPSFAGERDINSAREIDVIWFDEGENPRYCFEVEHSMDILRSLNRLLQLEHFHVKFIVVGPEEKRSKFEIEMSKFPFRRMKDRYKFVSYEELAALFEVALPFREMKDKLLGE